jgi:hypothetical protein
MVDIGNYSSIYHLHIPRTGGVFIRNQLLNQYKGDQCFATHYQPLKTHSLFNYRYVSGHFGTYPISHMNNPKVFTVLRNPVDRFLSYYKYTRAFFNEDMLDKWLWDKNLSSIHANTQTKFLSNPIDIDIYNINLVNKNTVNSNWFIGQDANMQKAQKFVDTNEVFFMEQLDDLFNIDNPIKVNNSGKKPNITQEQYDRIVELNSLDIELYEYSLATKKY